jgi:D-sedoheptulose 7-phosphate isomerase
MSAELVGRFMRDRKGLASIALTTDTSALTSIGNDFGYVEVFRRQIEALARPGDVVIGISTSGRSKNIILALDAAKTIGTYRVGLTGVDGADVATLCDECICVPSKETPRIQEAHGFIGHMLCKIVDDAVGNV